MHFFSPGACNIGCIILTFCSEQTWLLLFHYMSASYMQTANIWPITWTPANEADSASTHVFAVLPVFMLTLTYNGVVPLPSLHLSRLQKMKVKHVFKRTKHLFNIQLNLAISKFRENEKNSKKQWRLEITGWELKCIDFNRDHLRVFN